MSLITISSEDSQALACLVSSARAWRVARLAAMEDVTPETFTALAKAEGVLMDSIRACDQVPER